MKTLPRMLARTVCLGLICLAPILPSLASAPTETSEPLRSTDSPWQQLETHSDASLRGLHVVSDQLVWASGTGGTVLRSIDGGKTFEKQIVVGGEELDFRDIHAFDEDSAVIMSAGTPARIYRTDDGGKTWALCFEHPSDKAFFDAVSFWDDKHGVVMSDPVDDRVLLVGTSDGGKTWTELKSENRPVVIPGEGGFAASGTNMVVLPNGDCLIALGSAKPDEAFENSRVVRSSDRGKSWTVSEIPISRTQSSGVFSMAFANSKIGVAVGGDYSNPNIVERNIAVTKDGGKTWTRPSGKRPRGYRSGVAARVQDGSKGSIVFIAVGTSGTDRSVDNGQSWQPVSDDAFHAVQFSPTGKTGFASGAGGKIARWK